MHFVPVAEGSAARRWHDIIWEEVSNLILRARFDRPRFTFAARSLLPWPG
ncbi:hypothetical protein BN440_1754 [Erwinia amylovora MR1]|nr:hypothetical protein BN440_1754 [Erwinia amylovora MR1]